MYFCLKKDMQEQWVDIIGYEGLYQISNLGRVKSLEKSWITGRGGIRHQEEKLLKLGKTKDGYLYVTLYKNGKPKLFKVHRLVAVHFIPNPNNLPQVNHKDEVKTNNIVINLEWCTHQYNNNYGTRNERVGKAMLNHKAISIPILQIDKDTNKVIREWPSSMQVERELCINNSHIIQCCKGKRKTAGKFKWRYSTY